MELAQIRSVVSHGGPYATVYLEGDSPDESSADRIRLRWNSLRAKLADYGAAEDTVAALDEHLGAGDSGEQEANGRVLVAAGGRILMAEPWDAALGTGDAVHWSEEPELGAYLREASRALRALIVITDQEGAQLRQEVIGEQHEPSELAAAEVEGAAHEGVHKPRGGALSHNQIRRHAEENMRHNVQDVVQQVRKVGASFRPQVLVLAGEVQARTAVRERLPGELAEILVETDSGGRDSHASDETLGEELLQIAAERSMADARRRTEQFHAGRAHSQAVEGTQQVADAADRGAVETLLFRLDRRATDEACLVAACARTDSSVALVAEDTEMTDNVGALLRFPITE